LRAKKRYKQYSKDIATTTTRTKRFRGMEIGVCALKTEARKPRRDQTEKKQVATGKSDFGKRERYVHLGE